MAFWSDLKTFLRQNPRIGLAEAERPVSGAQLKWVEGGGRLALIQDGQVVAAVVSLDDLQLLVALDQAGEAEPLDGPGES